MDDLFNPDHFRHSILMTVRFADLDALAHVNHAAYLTYMEQARMSYAKDVWGWDGDMKHLSIIVARVAVDYKAPLFLSEQVRVWTRCSRLGTKSFDLAYLVQREGKTGPDSIVATGITGMVAYDYATNQTIAFPTDWRQRTLAYEPALS
ncbi:MAG: acyl-CoA thioesterase [Chloroflexi bacterium]|nr:acyl-CoA thioesterase [Chloroflexota bacterium]